MQRDLQPRGQALVPAEVVDHTLGEIELSIVDERVVDPVADALVVIDAPDGEALPSRHDGRRGVTIDRGAQHHATTLVAVRRNIGAAAAEADAKWGPGTDQHGTTLARDGSDVDAPTCSKIASITLAVVKMSRYGIGTGTRSMIER